MKYILKDKLTDYIIDEYPTSIDAETELQTIVNVEMTQMETDGMTTEDVRNTFEIICVE